jgi:ABC-type phosphate/phosphonate transport system substrate-binding protein
MTRSISLPMYDFPEVLTSSTALLEALSVAFTALGEDAQPSFPESSEHEHLMTMWKDDDTLLSQSCGLPFVEELHDYVDVIATLKWTGIVVRESSDVATLSEAGGLQPVITNTQSLSGWCSLGVALSDVTTDPQFVQPYVESGGHAKSLQMLQDKKADLASIDPGTFQLLSRHRPTLTRGLRVIGLGPLVPATPLHVSKIRNVSLDQAREAVLAVLSRPELAGARAEIGIDGVVPMSNEDYSVIAPLIERAHAVLPR